MFMFYCHGNSGERISQQSGKFMNILVFPKYVSENFFLKDVRCWAEVVAMRRCRGDSKGVTLARTGHLEMISVILL